MSRQRRSVIIKSGKIINEIFLICPDISAQYERSVDDIRIVNMLMGEILGRYSNKAHCMCITELFIGKKPILKWIDDPFYTIDETLDTVVGRYNKGHWPIYSIEFIFTVPL